jgi:protein-L-isoaspartate(D-aspartate) O-methyltransferase
VTESSPCSSPGPTGDSELTRLRAELVRGLVADGALRTGAWREVFETVPRHHFVPSFYRRNEQGKGDGLSKWTRLGLGEPGYDEGVYTDTSLITQLTDGVPTSSSSQPGLMAIMLEALDVRGRERVLEIATGTGYNAALLAERLGSANVTTVEVDGELAAAARARLRAAGYAPAVTVADGRGGHPRGAPYDRLIATCGFSSVPYALVRQVRVGGVLVVPLGPANIRLVVSGGGEDGKVAGGRFLPGGAYFMSVRDAGETGVTPRPDVLASAGELPARATSLNPEALRDSGFRLALSLLLPGVTGRAVWFTDEEGRLVACEVWDTDGAWARVEVGAGVGAGVDTGAGSGTGAGEGVPGAGVGVGTVRQWGPRRLWDAIERAHGWYEAAGRPEQVRFGLTVAAGGATFWLDDPAHAIPPALRELP